LFGNDPVKSPEAIEEEEYFKKFLETDRLHFGFEKMMISR